MKHRRPIFLLTVFGIVAILYLLVSLYLPSSRRLIVGIDKDSGKVRAVQQRITFLPPHQFYRLSFEKREGQAQRSGLVQIISSREKVPVKITYKIRFGLRGGKLPDADRLVEDGWTAWMNERIAEVMTAITSQVPVEDFASPSSEFSAQRDRIRQTVAKHLARSGLQVTAFEIERIEVDRDALLKKKRLDLRRNARGPVGRVLLIGLDGADWELLTELMIDDRLPNIKAIVRGGASFSLQTIQPTVSPMLWTTLATGVAPDRHGVVDFVDQARNGAPVDSRSRNVPAVWDIASAFGRTNGVVNFWSAWPPTNSDSFIFDTPSRLNPAAASPESLSRLAETSVVPLPTVGYAQVSRFFNITAAEYEQSANSTDAATPTGTFRALLAKTWSDHRAGINYYSKYQPMFFAINFEGTDTVNHLFGPYHPPFREGIPSEEYRKYWPTVANYYSEVDRLIGEWMTVRGTDATVMLVSTHGMQWGKTRPRTPPMGASALTSHRNPGVLVLFGNGVSPNQGRRAASIYDITPTTLAILGLPKSKEMPGNVIPAFMNLQPITNVPVTSYSELLPESPVGNSAVVNTQLYTASLRQIGHLTDPNRVASPVLESPTQQQSIPTGTAVWGQYAHLNNSGVTLKQQKKNKDAVAALVQATELNPGRPTPYLNLAIVLMDMQQYSAADEVFFKAINRGLPNPERYIIDLASYYRNKQMVTRAINVLVEGRKIFPQSPHIAANLGSALAAGKRYTEAVPELERALSLQPTSTLVLNNLGIMYLRRNEYGRALDYFNRSLSIQPRQPLIRDTVRATSSWL